MDSLAHRVVGLAHGAKPVIIEGRKPDELRTAAVTEAVLPYAPTFLRREWEQVILAQDLRGEIMADHGLSFAPLTEDEAIRIVARIREPAHSRGSAAP